MSGFTTKRGRSARPDDGRIVLYLYSDRGAYLGSVYCRDDEEAGELERRIVQAGQPREMWNVWWWPEGLEQSGEPPVPVVSAHPSFAAARDYAQKLVTLRDVAWCRVLGPHGEMEPDLMRWSPDTGWTART